jgi:short-subunit dehydrogenase
MKLEGSVAILTGASRGIGVYLAEALAAQGVHLALAARSEADLELTASKVERRGVRTLQVATDVTERADLQNLVERATAELGPVDLVVNNAGIEHYGKFETYDDDLMEQIYKTNVLAAQWLTKLALPGMIERKRGHIANIASVAGKTAVPYNSIYSSSKHALVGFSWSLREEMRKHGVGVSVICPGFVSGAGMFADWSKGAKPPKLTKTVTPEKVAAKTIEAIEKDKAEVIVAAGLVRFVDVFHALSPGFTTGLARRTGGYKFLENEAVRAWEQKG